MKFKFKLLALLLALILALSAVGCNTSDSGDSTSGADVTDSSPVEETTSDIASAPSVYTLVENGVANVRVVRPSDLKTDDMAVEAAIEIRKNINTVTGASPELSDDWLKNGESHDSTTVELLIGPTNYPETAEAIKDLTYGEYTVKAVGNKIVVFSYTESGYGKAINALISLFRSSVTDGADGKKTLAIPSESLNIVKQSEAMPSALPSFEGGKFSSVTDMGDGTYGVLIKNASTDDYNKYLAKLADVGYQIYRSAASM